MITVRVHVKRAPKLAAPPPDRARSAFLAGACLAAACAGSPADASPCALLAVPQIQYLAAIEHSVFPALVWRI